MIISASRRTDIPAFYSEWLVNRLKEGFALVRNPRNYHQLSRIALTPEQVEGIVLWTKNPAPMLDRLPALKDYVYYFQFTLTPYGRDVEPGLPDKDRVMIPVFQELSRRIGRERVVWRYDPIFFGRTHTPQWHLQRFHEMAARLSGYTEECVISFLDYYRNTQKQMEGLGLVELASEERTVFLRKLAQAAAGYGLRLKACAEDPSFRALGILPSSCVDAARLERVRGGRESAGSSREDIGGGRAGIGSHQECMNGSQAGISGDLERAGRRPVPAGRDRNQRPLCGCAASVDIGVYNTCAHGCRYCYANYNPAAVRGNRERYSPEEPLLCGRVEKGDVVRERRQ